ncbi:hypothetical protein EMWEY_00021220 [Eimeria maxima]|uniref:Uncharacterized protein n=1 Tax=Eimeria maxima TaxID=5804 RepID=U6M9Y6_EIMMA|nr:hypothetical protein EMWEY_00021220 [Eimeria maxima]CDJ59299.1 hypothetical protein EMWEY_00021220 [Eimeria maxima]
MNGAVFAKPQQLTERIDSLFVPATLRSAAVHFLSPWDTDVSSPIGCGPMDLREAKRDALIVLRQEPPLAYTDEIHAAQSFAFLHVNSSNPSVPNAGASLQDARVSRSFKRKRQLATAGRGSD